ncbi:MFS transporter [Methanoregula sp.]|uniref:MFS transporter n=1 Tax=Methanoregula sp. TaxID=2052170 RepID=UPI002372672D|nr:MFS transporter [Methanoregula sp.]MDD1685846.1 MFS transporter [Methanoregula sp.]
MIRTRDIALFIALLAGFLTPFDLSAVNIALPSIGGEYAMDAIEMSWIATAYLLASGVFLLPFGRLADIYGRKKIFTTGLFIFSLASILMIFSVSSLMIILVRVLQGFGGAMIFGTAVAILSSVTPPCERGKVLGIYTTAVYLGLSTGPFFGGILTEYFGWRSIFLVNIPVGLFAVALILLFLKDEWADSRGEPFDTQGAIQYGLALVCVMYGFSLLPDITGIILLIAGSAILAWFILRELRIRYPLLDVSLFTANRVFAFSNLAALINYCATFAVTFFLSLYLQYIKDFSPQQAGMLLVVQPVAQALFSPVAGRLSDRIDPGKIASAGMGLTALGLVCLLLVDTATTIPELILILIILGIGLGLFSSPNTNAIMGSVDKKRYGVASGTLGTMRIVGQMLSMGIAMMVLAIFIGDAQITPLLYPEFLDSMRICFGISAVLCIAGIFFSLVRYTVIEGPGDRCA